MDELCITRGAPKTEVAEGTDETEHAYVRYISRLEGPVSSRKAQVDYVPTRERPALNRVRLASTTYAME